MKTKFTISVLAVLTFILFSPQINFAQKGKEKNKANKEVYWFNLKIKPEKEGIKIKSVSKEGKNSVIKSGSLKQYNKVLKKKLKKGNKFIIGPFSTESNAKKASALYSNTIKETDAKEGYYFIAVIEIKEEKKKQSYDIERLPGKITKGKPADFKKALTENLPKSQLIIGPFTTQAQAEEAKRMYAFKGKKIQKKNKNK